MKKYTNEQKTEVTKRYKNGEAVSNLSLEYGVSKATIYNWIKEYNQSVSNDKNISSVHLLNKKVKKLTEILEIKSLVECTPNSSLKTKLYELEKLYGKYTVHSLCEALNVDRGTYYNHVLRNKKQDTWYKKRKKEMTALIVETYDESNQIFGANKIVHALKSRGVKTSESYVRAIMKELGISSITPTSKRDFKTVNPKLKKDSLKMKFIVNAPNEVWVSDTTTCNIKERKYYICAIIDLFSRKVIAYKISTKHSTNLVTATFRMAYSIRQVKSLTFHSDKGSQFTSNSFMKMLDSLNIKQSFSPTGSPYHNAVIESFFSYLKREEIYRSKYRSYNEFKRGIDGYISFYNCNRPHSYLNYKTPVDFEELYNNKLDKIVQK